MPLVLLSYPTCTLACMLDLWYGGACAELPLMVWTALVDQTGFGIVGRQWSGVEASVGTWVQYVNEFPCMCKGTDNTPFIPYLKVSDPIRWGDLQIIRFPREGCGVCVCVWWALGNYQHTCGVHLVGSPCCCRVWGICHQVVLKCVMEGLLLHNGAMVT